MKTRSEEAAGKQATYRTQRLGPDAREEALDLMRVALGDNSAAAKTERYWNWKHLNTPFGASHVIGARSDDGELASLRVLMRWDLQAPGGRRVNALRPVDTATHPEHQRRGLFKKLTLRAVDEAIHDGFALLFNTPNENSRPGYLKMGWRVVNRWPLYARPTRLGRLVRRKKRLAPKGQLTMPWAVFREIKGLDIERVVTDSEARRVHVGWRTPRDMAYLDWRYGQAPDLDYMVVPRVVDGQVDGFLIGRMATGMYGLQAFLITEMFYRDPSVRKMASLLRNAASTVEADYMVTYFPEGSVERKAMRKTFFLKLPRRGYTFVARPLEADLSPDCLQPESWDLTLGELEIF
jgi:GNAT superfamily N-acetyltransferase